jgi:biotin carboxyl carrier protein
LITGVVKEIFVKKGDVVKRGDCLLLLEAMKMNNEILSPINGIVQDIFVTENDNIPKGTMMVKIATETGERP